MPEPRRSSLNILKTLPLLRRVNWIELAQIACKGGALVLSAHQSISEKSRQQHQSRNYRTLHLHIPLPELYAL
jgi:hypothetical protein